MSYFRVRIIFFPSGKFFAIKYIDLSAEAFAFVTQPIANNKRGIPRYFIVSERTSFLEVISFDRLTRTKHAVRIVNFSIVGVGIESIEPIEHGLVCFQEQVGGQKFGVLTWSRQDGDRYRAGILFVDLPQEQEAYLQKQVKQSHPHQPLHDPEKIIAGLIASLKRETKGD